MIKRQKDLLYVYWTRGVIYMNKFKRARKDHLGPKPISREEQLIRLIFEGDYKPERPMLEPA